MLGLKPAHGIAGIIENLHIDTSQTEKMAEKFAQPKVKKVAHNQCGFA